MLTPEKLAPMSPEEKTALFERMAAAYGKTWAKLAADLGLGAPRTMENWRSRHIVPDMALYTLDLWVNSAEAQLSDRENLKAAAAEVEAAIARASKLLERIRSRSES